jgi:hypothetical protein
LDEPSLGELARRLGEALRTHIHAPDHWDVFTEHLDDVERIVVAIVRWEPGRRHDRRIRVPLDARPLRTGRVSIEDMVSYVLGIWRVILEEDDGWQR